MTSAPARTFWLRQRHGGDLESAAGFYDIAVERWLDLSTGISPRSWPAPPIPVEILRALPHQDDALERAAQACYGGPLPLAAAGSQALLALLPQLWHGRRVAIPRPGYREHAMAWRKAGHRVYYYDPHLPDQLAEWIENGRVDCVVVIQPHNPLGIWTAPQQLLDWSRMLASRDGVLVVDEAFADLDPQQSVAPFAGNNGLVVLRSLGKFFGLAGLRLGFSLSAPGLRRRLLRRLGPWSVSAPAQWLGCLALKDFSWQQQQRDWITQQSQQLLDCVQPGLAQPLTNAGLFLSAELDIEAAVELADHWARRGILVRIYRGRRSGQGVLRLGLPDKKELDRLLGV